MSPYVLLRLPNGEESLLRPGDLIGRHRRCELMLVDQRISEMHAAISVRGRSLRLLGLRGGVAIDGRVVPDPILEVGQRLELAPGLALEVRAIHLPQETLALVGPGLPRVSLSGTTSLYLSAPCELRNGYRPDADAWFFDDGASWFCVHGQTTHGPLEPGELQLGPWRGTLVMERMKTLPDTMRDPARQRPSPLRIESWFDVVRVFKDGELRVQLSGKKARVVSELMQVGVPVGWEAVAGEIWPGEEDRWALRKRWDTTIRRIRRAFSDASIRPDLIDSDGRGSVSLVPYPGDELVCHD